MATPIADIHSSLEEWRPVEGFPDYEVSSLGVVRSWKLRGNIHGRRADYPRIMKTAFCGPGRDYERVILTVNGIQTGRKIHHLVLEAFVGPRPSLKHGCNHKNSKRWDNRADNLEWMTQKENMQHAWKYGFMTAPYGEYSPRECKGEANGNAKLTERDVLRIRELFNDGHSQVKIADFYGVTNVLISKVIRRKLWSHVP